MHFVFSSLSFRTKLSRIIEIVGVKARRNHYRATSPHILYMLQTVLFCSSGVNCDGFYAAHKYTGAHTKPYAPQCSMFLGTCAHSRSAYHIERDTNANKQTHTHRRNLQLHKSRCMRMQDRRAVSERMLFGYHVYTHVGLGRLCKHCCLAPKLQNKYIRHFEATATTARSQTHHCARMPEMCYKQTNNNKQPKKRAQ